MLTARARRIDSRLIALVAAILVVLASATFIVDQRQQALALGRTGAGGVAEHAGAGDGGDAALQQLLRGNDTWQVHN